MNVQLQRFLCGVAVCGALAGQAQAQDTGIVRLDDVAPETDANVPGVVSLNGPGFTPQYSAPTVPPPGYWNVNEIFDPIFRVDTRGGQLYGYETGYTSVGAFMPFEVDENSLIFADVRGLVTNYGQGGGNAGFGFRRYYEQFDRILGASFWYDFDNGHRKAFNQVGYSLESLGRYLDYRSNGYFIVGSRDRVVGDSITGIAGFQGNYLFLNRGTLMDSGYNGFDTEIGGPFPILGRYGLKGYVGGYYFYNRGDNGSFLGVSGRVQAQLNEDLFINLSVTDDHTFGTNTQIQVVATIPNHFPSRWLRPKSVFDRLKDPVQRNYRAAVQERVITTQEVAIDPADGNPYFFAYIDPNATGPGTGTYQNQFSSLANYTALQANKGDVDVILVRPRTDGTSANLNTGITLVNTGPDTQRLWSTTVDHTLPLLASQGGAIDLSATDNRTTYGDPILTNTVAGSNVVTLTGGQSGFEISGFNIKPNATGNGIVGSNNSRVTIDRNEISGGLNGVLLTGLYDTDPNGSSFTGNTFHDNSVDGLNVASGGDLQVTVTGNTAYGNGKDGMQFTSNVGSLTGTFSGNKTTGTKANGRDGLVLTAVGGSIGNGGTGTPGTATGAVAITENDFSGNTGDGLALEMSNVPGTNNVYAVIQANTFTKNGGSGVHYYNTDPNNTGIPASGTANIQIGGLDDAHGNTFSGNTDAGVSLDASGASTLAATILHNTADDSSGTGNGTGFRISQADTATVVANVANNTANKNGIGFNYTGTGGTGLITSSDNTTSGNTTAGGIVNAAGGALMNFTSNRDNFSGNTGDGLQINSAGTAQVFAALHNITASNNTNGTPAEAGPPLVPAIIGTSYGLGGTATDQSTLTVTVDSPDDPLFNATDTTKGSTFSNNDTGVNFSSKLTSNAIITLDQVSATDNNDNGAVFNRSEASLMTVAITDTNTTNTRLSTYSNNGKTVTNPNTGIVTVTNPANGIQFNYAGSNPIDPNQPLTGTPNTIFISNTTVNGNTTNGFQANGDAKAELLANVVSSTFNNNTQAGVDIEAMTGSSFGDVANRSTFDNVTITGNGADGMIFHSGSDIGVGATIYAQVVAVTGSSLISGNSGNGILMNTDAPLLPGVGGYNDIRVIGDGTTGDTKTTFISGNDGDGVGGTTYGTSVFTLVDATIGGPTAAQGNKGDGIGFVADINGDASVNVGVVGLVTTIQNNGGDGINMQSNVPDANIPNKRLTASSYVTVENGQILDNKGNGVEITTRSRESKTAPYSYQYASITDGTVIGGNGGYGILFDQRGAVYSSYTVTGSTIQSNGYDGFKLQADAGNTGFNNIQGNFPQPTTPTATPFNPITVLSSPDATSKGFANGVFDAATGNPIGTTVADDRGTIVYSQFMNLTTTNNTSLIFTGNTVQFNGVHGAPTDPTDPASSKGDGVYLNISTDSYVQADVSSNTFTGNRLSDFRTASFIKTVSVGGGAVAKPASTAVADPARDTVVLDDTAQLDLRFFGNHGDSLNINNLGITSAVEKNEFLLDYGTSDTYNPNRLVQLFQVDLGTDNIFTVDPSSFYAPDSFATGNYNPSTSWPNGPSPASGRYTFRNYNASPGNPFSP